jgi:hypothetical protein
MSEIRGLPTESVPQWRLSIDSEYVRSSSSHFKLATVQLGMQRAKRWFEPP